MIPRLSAGSNQVHSLLMRQIEEIAEKAAEKAVEDDNQIYMEVNAKALSKRRFILSALFCRRWHMGEGKGLDIMRGLSAHFDLMSSHALKHRHKIRIDNTPPPDVVRRLWSTAGHMEMIRFAWQTSHHQLWISLRCA